MDSLRAMFPGLDPSTLQATLDAHEGSVERAVDYLLSSHQPNNERATQEQQDEQLARRLQAEDAELYDQQQQHTMNDAQHQQQHRNNSNNNPNDSNNFTLPSLADVQSAVQPIVNGVAYAGRMAANSVSGFYRELIGDEESNSTQRRPSNLNDDSVVVRNEGSSPGATRSSARQRRPEASSIGRSYGDKKDD